MTGSDLAYALDPVRWARERLGFEPDAKQAAVLAGRASRGILNCARQWGKSTVTAVMALHQACFRAGSLTLVVSPSLRQSAELVRKAREFVVRLGMRARGDGSNEISLLLPNGSRIVGLPGAETTIRGFSAVGLLLVDEAARVSDGMYKAVRPMLAVGGGRLWLMSTPRGERGFFWEEWTRGLVWERVRATAAECGRITADFLAEERRALGERWFGQEYGCEFVETDAGMFERDVIGEAMTEEVEPLRV